MSAPSEEILGLDLESGVLDPATVHIRRTDRGLLAVRIGDGEEVDDATVRRAFPLEIENGYISLFDSEGNELGMIESIDGLEAESRKALEAQLSLTYFLPKITDISNLGEDYGVVFADVETTSGPRHIEIRGIRSSIRVLSGRRAVIEDAEGNRYELVDFMRLPKLTREILGL